MRWEKRECCPTSFDQLGTLVLVVLGGWAVLVAIGGLLVLSSQPDGLRLVLGVLAPFAVMGLLMAIPYHLSDVARGLGCLARWAWRSLKKPAACLSAQLRSLRSLVGSGGFSASGA